MLISSSDRYEQRYEEKEDIEHKERNVKEPRLWELNVDEFSHKFLLVEIEIFLV